MAETKKPVATLKTEAKAEVKEAAKKTEEKAAEVKAEAKTAAKKVETKAAEAKTEVKKAAKKTTATAKKAADKTADTAKKAAKKTAATAKKAADKTVTKAAAAKDAVKKAGNTTVHVQFAGKSYTTEDLVKIAKDVWVYDLGNKVADFKTAEIYVKPEESMAYYVINGNVAGSFAI